MKLMLSAISLKNGQYQGNKHNVTFDFIRYDIIIPYYTTYTKLNSCTILCNVCYRYNDISIAGLVPSPQNNVSVDVVVDTNPITIVTLTMELEGYETCEILLNSEAMRNLKKSEKQYDILITEIFISDCSAAFAHHFGVPLVSVISSVALPWSNERIGNPDHPAYIPNYFLPYTSQMTLLERLVNTVFTILVKLGYV